MDNRITKIELQKRNKNRANIFIDEEYKFSCDNELVYRYNLAKGQTVDSNFLEEIINEDNYLKGKTAALRIVERSYKTEKEIEDKLSLKGYDKATIYRIKATLKEYDFINDEKYARAYIKDNLNKQGKNKLEFNLAKKGISSDLIKIEMDNIDKEEFLQNAMAIGKKKYEQLVKREDDKYKLANKLASYLLSRGYEYQIARDITRSIMKPTEF